MRFSLLHKQVFLMLDIPTLFVIGFMIIATKWRKTCL